MHGGTVTARDRRQGFTLLETLLVLVLLVAVSGLVLVNMAGRSTPIKHADAVGLIVQSAVEARVEAMRSGAPVRLVATNRNTESRPRVRLAWLVYSSSDDEDMGGDVFRTSEAARGAPNRGGSGSLDDPVGWSDLGDPAGWSESSPDSLLDGPVLVDVGELPRGVSLVRSTIRPVVPEADPQTPGADAASQGFDDPRSGIGTGSRFSSMGGSDSSGFADADPWFSGAPGGPTTGAPGTDGVGSPEASARSRFGNAGPVATDTITLGVFLPDGTAWGDAPVLVVTDASEISRLTTIRATGTIHAEPMRFALPGEEEEEPDDLLGDPDEPTPTQPGPTQPASGTSPSAPRPGSNTGSGS